VGHPRELWWRWVLADSGFTPWAMVCRPFGLRIGWCSGTGIWRGWRGGGVGWEKILSIGRNYTNGGMWRRE